LKYPNRTVTDALDALVEQPCHNLYIKHIWSIMGHY